MSIHGIWPHNYPPGARVRGKIRNLTSYGAFLELEEGIDGMVHVSDKFGPVRLTTQVKW